VAGTVAVVRVLVLPHQICLHRLPLRDGHTRGVQDIADAVVRLQGQE
jgi:hypothetical protein